MAAEASRLSRTKAERPLTCQVSQEVDETTVSLCCGETGHRQLDRKICHRVWTCVTLSHDLGPDSWSFCVVCVVVCNCWLVATLLKLLSKSVVWQEFKMITAMILNYEMFSNIHMVTHSYTIGHLLFSTVKPSL